MKSPISIQDLNLVPKPGKRYWSSGRSWNEEIIYFLLIDRFHDQNNRTPVATAGKGFGTSEELKKICGGTINGVKKNLNYIKNLGCTSIWLSPVFENNPQSYHGYSIQNFLKIDSRFGTIKDLEDLITEAHRKDIKIFLDVVLNHSGNNWFYQGNKEYTYLKGQQYKFGGWRSEAFPIPIELRNQEYYKRKGWIEHWDDYPEMREGDFFSLKKFNYDESDLGLALQEILLKSYCYWIRETDCDGFRIDAAKHIGELPAARFSSKVKEYAKLIGKQTFLIFGESPTGDVDLSKFLEPVYSNIEKKIYQGLDTMLDFPLHFLLPKIIKGEVSIAKLEERFNSIEKNLQIKKGDDFQLINFLDNHDQIENPYKKRIAAQLNDQQLIAALGLLYSLPGVPCLYYGTEQSFKGHGDSDVYIRESMFDFKNKATSALKVDGEVYKELAKIALMRKSFPELQFGKIVFPLVYSSESLEDKAVGIIIFLRKLFDQEILIVYNVSINELKRIYVPIDENREKLRVIYGINESKLIKMKKAGSKFINYVYLEVKPMELIIIKLTSNYWKKTIQ